MSDPHNFLSRWSRRKNERRREAEREQTPEAAASPPPQTASTEPAAPKPAQQKPPASASPAVFDPASLPSIESIAADSDISAFLQPGVPADLRNAALRRAWSVDPAIRNFKGLQENDWDFNDPNGIPGFGPLSPNLDVKKMVSALFGGPGQEPSKPAPAEQDAVTKRPSAAIAEGDVPAAAPPADMSDKDSEQNKFVHRDNNIATQNNDSEPDAKHRRRRGGALPEC